MSYQTNILAEVEQNRNFRKVLHTSEKTQLVAMRLPPKGDIGLETHDHVEQTFVVVSGQGIAIQNGRASRIAAGDILIVAPGTAHNITNDGPDDLALYTIYAPPNHIAGRIHATKADADRDEEDEAYGNGLALLDVALGGMPMQSASNGHSSPVVVPGTLAPIEPRPDPGSPLENPEAPPMKYHDYIR